MQIYADELMMSMLMDNNIGCTRKFNFTESSASLRNSTQVCGWHLSVTAIL